MVPFANSAAKGVGPGLVVELAGLAVALKGLEAEPPVLLLPGDADDEEEDEEEEEEDEEDDDDDEEVLEVALTVATGSGTCATGGGSPPGAYTY